MTATQPVSRRLHEITADFVALEELLLEAGGELTPEIEAWMAENAWNLDTKVDGYAALIHEWTADAEKWKAEEERCAGHRKARTNAAQRLKDRLCEELVRMDRLKVETPRFKVAVQRSAPSVEVCAAVELLPEAFRRSVTTVTADKTALKDALTAGGPITVDGVVVARLTAGTAFLRIR